MRRPYFLATLGVLLFLCGVAVGQVTRRSKFSKYQEPAFISRADWFLLQAEISAIQAHSSSQDGVFLPHFIFVPEINKFAAIVLVDRKQLDAEPASIAKGSLMDSEVLVQAFLEHFFPEVTNQDFEVQFKVAGSGEVYAEYKNGELTMH